MKQASITMCTLAAACLLLTMVMPVAGYAGGENRVGTSAAPELLIPVGARDIALGGSSIATTSGLEAIFWNPAGLARTKFGANAMFSHMSYIADIGVEYVAVSGTFEGFGTIGLSLKSLSIGDILVTSETVPDGSGQVISPTVVNLGLTYSRLLTDRISVGTTFTLISERFDRVASSGFALSAGVQYLNLGNVNGLSLGVAVKNIGPSMKFDGDGLLRSGNVNDVLRPNTFYKVNAASAELPTTVEIGLAYTVRLEGENVLNVAGVFQNNSYSADEYKMGAEYCYNDMFFVRGGYGFAQSNKDPTSPLSDKTSYIYGLTAGAGVRYPVGTLDFTFDYGFRAVDFLGDNHIFSIKLGF